MVHVLIAVDKFKGSLTAAQVAAAIRAGIHRVRPEAPVVVVPVADGGDGTLAAAVAAGYQQVPVTATGPTGEPVATGYARHGDLAVVELADVSGLVRLPDGSAPLRATSRGTGEVIAAALDAGARRIVLGIGGSAGTDGGAGLAQALGARLLDRHGQEIGDGGAALAELATIDLVPLRARLAGVEMTVACDVVNPLTGPLGAAAVYGPQKGASAEDVALMDQALTHWADVVQAGTGADLRDAPGAGAAGGVGFAAIALLDAALRPGTELVFELVEFHRQLTGATLVITGEGSLDEQTLHGKAPIGVAIAAQAAGIPVVAVCGQLALAPEQLQQAGIVAAYSLTDLEPDVRRCIAEAGFLLERVGEQIASDHLDRWAATGERSDVGGAPVNNREFDLVIRARRLIGPDGEHSASVGVRGGVISAIEPFTAELSAPTVVELADDEVLLPGLVDSHVHVNDPGRTEWEGFASATRAAAAGGVTTIVDMPLNSIPPTVDIAALGVKRTTAADHSYIDVGFWGGAVPGNVAQLRPLQDAGVFGFKCFLLHSGVEEFPHLDGAELELAMREVASFDGLLIVHAEDAHAIDTAPPAHGRHYADFLSSRPRRAEDLAIGQVIELARRTGCRVHILHLSSSDALPMIAEARAEGVRLSVETCPHYLCFTAEDIPDGATLFKCCPPIREGANRDELWRGLAEGLIDTIVSDHSPSTVDLKCLDTGDFGAAWGGVSSLQLGLPAVWTEARRRGFALSDVVRWMAQGPATQTGLRRKGAVQVGHDADFCILAPEESFVVDPYKLQHRNAGTPYAGRTLMGVVRSSWLRGLRLNLDAPPRGRLLARGDA